MIANTSGAYKTRTVKRVPEVERWKQESVEEVPWTPWKIQEKVEGSRNESEATNHESFIDIPVDKSIDLPPPQKVDEDAMPRRVYITKAVLDKIRDDRRMRWMHSERTWRNWSTTYGRMQEKGRGRDEE